MKAFKSMVLLTAGVLAFSACDKKSDNKTTATGTQDTTMGAGATPMTNDPNANSMMNTGVGAGAVDTHDHSADEAAAAGTGAAAGAATMKDKSSSTSEGSGAISDEAASEELNSDEYQDDEFSGTEVEEEEYGTGIGTGRGDNYESVDESSSEPNDVRGGRDARMVPKNTEIDNTSSEPDLDQ